MLSRLMIKLKKPEELFLSVQMSSLFHGFLMEQIDPAYGEILHRSTLKPYSHHLEINKEDVTWVIHTLDKEAHKQIIVPLLNSMLTEVYLEKKDIHLPVINCALSTLGYDELMETTFFANCPRELSLKFVTPTAFKTDGEYMFYPTVKHIFQSWINKYDACSENTQIYTPELMDDIEKNVKIIRYNLRSTVFNLEGVKIPAFVGEITMKIRGPQQMVNLMHTLASFGEYSGVGIKSAIGMGAVKIIEREKKDGRKTV